MKLNHTKNSVHEFNAFDLACLHVWENKLVQTQNTPLLVVECIKKFDRNVQFWLKDYIVNFRYLVKLDFELSCSHTNEPTHTHRHNFKSIFFFFFTHEGVKRVHSLKS